MAEAVHASSMPYPKGAERHPAAWQQTKEEAPPNSNVIVNYLPPNLTEDELINLFSPFGSVLHHKIVKDLDTHRSMGYGFVQFATAESAADAIAKLNGYKIRGKTLKVSVARPSSHDIKRSNLYIVGLPPDWTKNEITQYFCTYGQVVEARVLIDPVTMQSRGVGFCRLDSHLAALRAIQHLNGLQPPNSNTKLTIKLADNPNNFSKRDLVTNSAYAKPMYADSSYRPNAYYPQPIYPIQQQQPPFLKYPSPYVVNGMALGQDGTGMQQQMPLGHLTPNGVNQPQVQQQMSQPPQQGQQVQPQQIRHDQHLPPANSQQFQGSCLFVYHLPLDASDQTLYQIFSPYATVCSTKVMKDLKTGRSKGFGFVNVLTEQDGINAIQHLNNIKLGNKYIKISFKKK